MVALLGRITVENRPVLPREFALQQLHLGRKITGARVEKDTDLGRAAHERCAARLVRGISGQIHAIENPGVGDSVFKRGHARSVGPRNLHADAGVEEIRLVVDDGCADPDDRRFRPEAHATKRGIHLILQAVSGKPRLERIAPAVCDQAGVDLELAAKRDE